MAEAYLTDVDLANRYGIHRSTPWRWARTDPKFPKPVVLSPGCTRWKLSDIARWEKFRAA